jgi:hypothetical protein
VEGINGLYFFFSLNITLWLWGQVGRRFEDIPSMWTTHLGYSNHEKRRNQTFAQLLSMCRQACISLFGAMLYHGREYARTLFGPVDGRE